MKPITEETFMADNKKEMNEDHFLKGTFTSNTHCTIAVKEVHVFLLK